MHEFELTPRQNNRTIKQINKTARKSESGLKLEPEPPDILSQFWNRTRNRQVIWFSSRTGTGTGRNMDPLQQWTKSLYLKVAELLEFYLVAGRLASSNSYLKGLNVLFKSLNVAAEPLMKHKSEFTKFFLKKIIFVICYIKLYGPNINIL